MTGTELGVTLGAIALIGAFSWYFFGPKKAKEAKVRKAFRRCMSQSRAATHPTSYA
jgi:hypothetical protein